MEFAYKKDQRNDNNSELLYQQMVKYIQNYVLYESIGSGVYGKVYRAINNNDKKQYAIKVIPINKFKQNKKLQQCTVNQINILTNIQNHPNIIKYYDMLKTSNNFYFIYQYCNGGTLENLLSKQIKLTQQHALLIFKQLLEAFQVLNKYNIMHRDMKPDNIFFHNGVIKLGDFGFCKNLNSADQMTKTMLGSPIYMAPEVLKGEIYSNKADIWSVGVVLFQMIFGVCPFQSNSIANLIEVLNSRELQFPGPISPFLKNLITRMLTKDPQKRASWMELFQIKINSQGQIQNQKIANKINSLNQAKNSQQGQGQTLQSIKTIGKIQSNDQPNFKKNRNLSTTSANNQQQIAISNSPQPINIPSITIPINFGPPQQTINSPTLPPSISNTGNVLSPNSKPVYIEQQKIVQAIPTKDKESRVGDDHKLVIEGVKLALEMIQAKLPNHMGYAHLILTRTAAILNELTGRCTRREVMQVLQRQMRDIDAQREAINSKMFAYELKGLQDWKKYLRGKFFQEESTIIYWFKMVTFLNNSYGAYQMPQTNPAEVVKQILY